jgi:hypothetical protein
LIFSLYCFSCHSYRIQATCNSADYKKRLDGILSIIERKHRLDDKVRKIQHNASLAINNSISNNAEKSSGHDKENSPSISSKKIKKKQKLLSDEEPIQCIQEVMTLLQVAK